MQRTPAKGAVAEAAANGVAGCGLYFAVDRHANDEVRHFAAYSGARLFDCEVERVAHGAFAAGAVLNHVDALSSCFIALFGGDEACRDHCVQHDVLPRSGGFEVLGRRRTRRRFREPCEHGGFGERQFGGGLAEETTRGGVDAISLVAEINAVQIKFENLVLGQPALDA